MPLYQQTIDKIYSLIDSMEIQPGEKFPPERELAVKWGISRNSLRDAFHILEHRGVVISKQGSGRYLRNKVNKDEDEAEVTTHFDSISRSIEQSSLLDIYCTRQLLEPKIVEEVARHATPEQIQTIKAGYEHFAKIFNASGNTKEEFGMHRLYASCCGNYFLAEMVELAYKATEDLMLNRFRSEYFDKHTVEESLQAHGQIIDAIVKRDMEAAKSTMFNHLQHTLDML